MSEHRICANSDSLIWANHYKAQALEYIKRAETSYDDTLETHFRSLAQRFLRLAEAEEFATLAAH